MAGSKDDTKFEYFTGEDPKEQPKKWLKRLENKIRDTAKTDEAKIKEAGAWIDADTRAEVWFEKEGKALASWEDFRKEFIERFERKTVESPQEAEEKVLAVELKAEELGTMVKDKDGDIMGKAHEVWIDKVCQMARKVKAADGVAERVRWRLPIPLRKHVTGPVKDFEELQKKIYAVTSEQLQNELESWTGPKEPAERSSQTPDTPTSSIRRSMRGVRLDTEAEEAPPLPEAEFLTDRRMRPSNLFYPRSRLPPPPPPFPPARTRGGPYRAEFRPTRNAQERLRLLNENALAPPTLTVEGQTTYQQQLSKWNTDYPGSRAPNETRPYPLTPGTAPVGSNECFRCGKIGHRSAQCNSTMEIPPLESQWRQEAMKIKRQANTANFNNAAATYYVNAMPDAYGTPYDPYFAHWAGYYQGYGYEDGQGNE